MFLILGVITFGLIMVNNFMKDQRLLRATVITVNAEKVSAQARVQELVNAKVQLEAVIEVENRFREETRRELEELNETFTQIRLQQESQKQVLEGDQLNRLANSRKQNLIERLSNKATRARFNEVEAIFDGS